MRIERVVNVLVATKIQSNSWQSILQGPEYGEEGNPTDRIRKYNPDVMEVGGGEAASRLPKPQSFDSEGQRL